MSAFEERMLTRLTPFQRELLGNGFAVCVMTSLSIIVAGTAFSISSGNIYALSAALWVPVVFSTVGYSLGADADRWKRAIHVLPISRSEKQDANWWVYVVAVPAVYSVVANCTYVFAAFWVEIAWPWHRLFELPLFYISIHALLFFIAALTRRPNPAWLLIILALCTSPFVFNANAFVPATPFYYPIVCVLLVALSYCSRNELFRFDFNDFSSLYKPEPADEPEEVELLPDLNFDIVADSAVAVSWGSAHPFRAQILNKTKRAVLTTTALCALFASVFWLAGWSFGKSPLPSVLLASISAISSTVSLNRDTRRASKALRLTPVSHAFLTRFAVGLRLSVPLSICMGAAPWLWWVWDQRPLWILSAMLYGTGISLLIFATRAVQLARDLDRDSEESMVLLRGFFLIAILAPFWSEYIFVSVAPVLFVVSLAAILLINRRYSLI